MLKNTEQNLVDEIYDILESVAYVLCKQGIEYSIASGTLLGAYRHGGFIPWDDDADLFLLDEQLEQVKQCETLFAEYGLEVHEAWHGMRYAFSKDRSRSPIPAYPFVDIFPLVQEADRLVIKSTAARAMWPNEYVYVKDWENRVVIGFAHLHLSALNHDSAMSYLDRVYGADWRTHVYQVWDHLKDQPVEKVKFNLPRVQYAAHSKCTKEFGGQNV